MKQIFIVAAIAASTVLSPIAANADAMDDVPKPYKIDKQASSIDSLEDIVNQSVKEINNKKIDNDNQFKQKEDNKKADEQKRQDEEKQKELQKQQDDAKAKLEEQQKQNASQQNNQATSNQVSNNQTQSQTDTPNVSQNQSTDQLKFIHSAGFTPMLGVRLTYYNPTVLGWHGSSIQGGIHISPDENGVYKDDQGNIAIAANKSVAIGTKISTELGHFIVVDHSEGNYDLVVNW